MQEPMYYRFEIGSIIREHPILFLTLIRINNRIRGWGWPAYLERDTELMIEGYFRSGNTFAVRAFMVAQESPTRLAHHTHAIASVSTAVRQKIPVLMLLRDPADTVISATLKQPGTTVRQHLRWYIRYYERVWQLRSSMVIALFDEVVEDFGAVIERVNQRYDTHFTPFYHTRENAQEVLNWIKEMDSRIYSEDTSRYSIPVQEKEAPKKILREHMEQYDAPMLERAHNLFQRLAEARMLS